MARGIITTKPTGAGGTGATTAGKIIVTEGTVASHDGTGDATPAALALETGSTISYPSGTTEKEGDLVDFSIDAASGTAKINSVVKTGTLITNSTENIIVSAGQSVVIAGTVEGKVTVNGGILAIAEKSKIGGKLESSTAGSYIFANSAIISAKVEIIGASYVSLQGTTIEAKVTSDGTNYTSVKDCIINGSLDVINSADCKCSGNTVDGKTNTPNCK
jgi:hypothetical protein